MLSYKRQLARAQSETDKLRSQRTAYQIRTSRVEQEWTAIVAEANLRLPSTSAAAAQTVEMDAGALELDVDALLAMTDEDLDEALSQRSLATKALLGRLQSLPSSASSSTSASATAELDARCADLVAQSAAAREHLRILRAEHTETLGRLEETHARLVKAERKFDRMQSRSVAEVEGRPDPTAVPVAPKMGESSAGERRGSVASQDPEGRDSPLGANGATASSSDPGGSGAGQTAAEVAKVREETEALRELVARRAQELEDLRNERVELKLAMDTLKGKVGVITVPLFWLVLFFGSASADRQH